MSAQRAIRSYKTVSVESAPPTRILDDLLARLITDCHVARERILAGDPAGKGVAINHALAIVGELVAALDPNASPELTANLASLWQYVADQLTAANIKMDPKPLAEAERVVATLREAFAVAAAAR